jgi:phosphotransacetylase
MADRGEITGADVEGPLAMDNAVFEEAARIKGITSPVAGRADILIAPDLESGNILAKSLDYLAGAEAAGIALGARIPIALTSRADNPRERRASAALAVLVAARNRRTE